MDEKCAIILAFNDFKKTKELIKWIGEIKKCTLCPHYEIIIASNRDLKNLSNYGAKIVEVKHTSNLAHIFNKAILLTDANFIIFFFDLFYPTKGWLSPLIKFLQKDDVGIVFPKIIYKNGKIYFAGIAWTPKYTLKFLYRNILKHSHPAVNKIKEFQIVSECFALKKDKFILAGMFNEHLRELFEIDFSYKIRKMGLKIYRVPQSTLIFKGKKKAAEYKGDNVVAITDIWIKDIKKDEYTHYKEDDLIPVGKKFKKFKKGKIAIFIKNYFKIGKHKFYFNTSKLKKELIKNGYEVHFYRNNVLGKANCESFVILTSNQRTSLIDVQKLIKYLKKDEVACVFGIDYSPISPFSCFFGIKTYLYHQFKNYYGELEIEFVPELIKQLKFIAYNNEQKISAIKLERERLPFKFKNLSFKKEKEPLVSIIIPVYNKWEYTYFCLLALKENTKDINYEVIVIDDCSTDFTKEMLSKIKGIKVIRNSSNQGFLRNCNKGADVAKGKYLLFLNNDTIPLKNWLKYLIEIAEKDPKVGAVGAKLIFPSGALQEAGGIVWNHPVHFGWNYGKGHSPDWYEFNYVKEVDYCSGACLLVRRDLFFAVGKFDERYSPAYCEDTDLCFKIRKAGYKVVYQPKSTIIHFEGISSGRDLTSGVKKYQLLNQFKFHEKWKETLEKEHFQPGEHVFLARDRSKFKKILLFIDAATPTWDKDAGSLSTFQYLKLLKEMDFKIIFTTPFLLKVEPYTSYLQSMGIEVIYGAIDFEKWLSSYGSYIHYVWISRPNTALSLGELIKKYTNAKILYCMHDLHFLRKMREYSFTRNSKDLEESYMWKKVESHAFNIADIILTFSHKEKEILEGNLKGKKIYVIPLFIFDKIPVNEPPLFKERKDILYLGGFKHSPNIDAVEWLIKDIYPSLKKKIKAKLYIVGSEPPDEIKKQSSRWIKVTGFVEDITPFFNRMRIFLSPLRFGAGLKGKIVMSMAHGLPVVTTPIGAEGFLSDEIMIVRENAEEIIDAAAEIYTNEKLWKKIQENALEYVKDNFSKSKAQEILKEICEI